VTVLEYLKEKEHITIPSHEFSYKPVTNRDWIGEHCVCLKEFEDFGSELVDILVESECILEGHFELLSGKHSQYFLRFSKIARYVHLYKPIAKRLTRAIRERNIEFDALLSPDTAGSALSYGIQEECKETHIQLFTSKTDIRKRPTDEINFVDAAPGTRVIIVNDMTTTGVGIEKLLRLAVSKECIINGVVLFANQDSSKTNIQQVISSVVPYEVPLILMCEVNFPGIWDKDECPLCPEQLICSYFLN